MQIKVGRAFRYQFQLTLHRLDVQIPFPCSLELHWSRNGKKTACPNRIQIKGVEKSVAINSKLTLVSTCFLKESLDFLEKKSIISVIIHINDEPKNGGYIALNLSSILNPINHKISIHKEFDCILQKSILKNARLKFDLKSTYIKEMMQQDFKQESTSVASSNGKSLHSFNFKDFNDIQGDLGSLNSFKSQRRSESISSSKGRSKVNSQVSDDYDLSQKQRHSIYQLQAENTKLRMFSDQHCNRIKQLLEEIDISKLKHQEQIQKLNQLLKVSQQKVAHSHLNNFQYDQLKLVNTQLNGSLDSTKRQYAQDISQLRRENSELQCIISKQTQALNNMEQTNNYLNHQLTSSSSELKNRQGIIEQLKKGLQKLKTDEYSTQKQTEQLLKTNIELQVQLRMHNENIDNTNNEKIQQFKRKIQYLQENLKDNEQIILSLKKQSKDKNTGVAILTEKVEILQDNLSIRNKEFEQMSRIIIEKEEKYNILTKEKAHLEQQYQQLRQKIEVLEQVVLLKEKQSAKKHDQIQHLRQNEIFLNNAIRDYKQLGTNQMEQLSLKDHNLSEQMLLRKTLEQSNRSLNQEMSVLSSQNKSISKANQMLLQQLAKSRNQTIQLRVSKQNGLLEKIDMLQNQLSRRDAKINKLQQQNRQLEQQNIKLNIKIMKELNELQKKHQSSRSGLHSPSGQSSQLYNSHG